MFRLAVIWFAVLASNPGHCWSDARFAAVRQLSAKQYQEGYKVLANGGDIINTDFKQQARSSRPLFSWDFIPPSPESLRSLSDAAMVQTETSTLSSLTVAGSPGKVKRKKNRNKRKHSAHRKMANSFSNETYISTTDRILNMEPIKQPYETEGTHFAIEQERDNVDRIRESFRLTKERKRKNKHRKDRTGKRKPKSERRKGNKRRRKGEKKLKRRGRKQKDSNLINNSLPTLANENFNKHDFQRNSGMMVPMQVESNGLRVNEIANENLKTTTEKHLSLEIKQSEISTGNNLLNNFTNIRSPERPDSFEMNGVKDNILTPILFPSNTDGEIYTYRKSVNTTVERKDDEDVSSGVNEVRKTVLPDDNNFNRTTYGDFSNNSLPNNIDTNLFHDKDYQSNKLPPQLSESNNTLGIFNDRVHKETIPSLDDKSKNHKSLSAVAHPSITFEENQVSSLDSGKQNITGDLTCLTGTFLPAPPKSGADIKYIRTQPSSTGRNTVYLIAEYECFAQHHLKDPKIYQLICSQRQWIGEQPSCIPDEELHVQRKDCGGVKGECDHICMIISGARVCSCYKGFRLDGNICRDINECDFRNGGCENECRNTLGSYHCICPTGLRLADNGKSCEDINECLLRNGHGPCQDTCLNRWGSYECSCGGIPGTRLAVDNHTCEDVDECADGTAGCSHTCLNTLGSAFCLCPAGFMLGDDWKTCQDINECAYEDLQTEHCELGCVNTIGSYHCLEKEDYLNSLQRTATELPVTCPSGTRSTVDGNCQDIDECEENTSGCAQSCLNTNGSYLCICGLGFSLASDNKTCIESAEEAVCPPLESPLHGYLECARHLVRTKKSRYPWLKRARVVNHAGSVCQLKCPHGYILEGEYRKTCGQDRKWTGPENGTCVPLPAPSIRCPDNMTVSLKSVGCAAHVTIPQPITNVNWFRYVEATPGWGKSLQASLPEGHWEVKYTARHPTSHLTASCIVTISVVLEKE